MAELSPRNPTRLDLTAYGGQDVPLPLEFTDTTGAPIDITGWVFASTVRNSTGAVVYAPTFAVVDATTGKAYGELPAATTLGLAPGTYAWDLLATLPADPQDGGGVWPLFEGSLEVTEPVTHPDPA